MKEITLRPYQQECVDVIDRMESGNGLVSMATGLGKTTVFTHIQRKGRVLILSHREELVHQPEKYYDCSFGVEQGKEHSNGEEVISASVQTMIHRLEQFPPDTFDTIITDEAHHAVAPSYKKIYSHFKPRLHIGFTATPNRADRVGLHEVYDKIIFNRDLRWGIENGYLSHIECVQVDIGFDVSRVKKVAGDFNEGELSRVMNEESVITGVAKAFKDYAVGQTVVFAVDVKHTIKLTEAINKMCGKGTAEAIVGTTQNRSEILERFQKKEIKCLVNCMVLTEGTDLPLIETVIMARPTSNQTLYTQAVGRALRLYPGKEKALLIDCVGISGKLKVCTAPDLLGLDVETVPEEKRKYIKGDLLDLEEQMNQFCDDPDSWILQAKAVDLFAEDIDIDTMDLNLMMQTDGSMVCPLSGKQSMMLTPLNELGLCNVCLIDERKNTQILAKNLDPQSAVRSMVSLLNRMYASDRNLWDMSRVRKWGKDKISDRQKTFIQRMFSSGWYRKKHGGKETDFNLNKLTKYEASLLINHLIAEKG